MSPTIRPSISLTSVACARRLQVSEPAANGGSQVAGVVPRPGRVSTVGDDLRQLLEAAGLQRAGSDAREAAPRRLRGATLLPSLVSAAPLTLHGGTPPLYVQSVSDLYSCDAVDTQSAVRCSNTLSFWNF